MKLKKTQKMELISLIPGSIDYNQYQHTRYRILSPKNSKLRTNNMKNETNADLVLLTSIRLFLNSFNKEIYNTTVNHKILNCFYILYDED